MKGALPEMKKIILARLTWFLQFKNGMEPRHLDLQHAPYLMFLQVLHRTYFDKYFSGVMILRLASHSLIVDHCKNKLRSLRLPLTYWRQISRRGFWESSLLIRSLGDPSGQWRLGNTVPEAVGQTADYLDYSRKFNWILLSIKRLTYHFQRCST